MDPSVQDAQLEPQAQADQTAPTGGWRLSLARIALVFGWASALLHIWPKDRWTGLSTWFYATPWGVVLAIAAASTVGCLTIRPFQRAKSSLRAAMMLLVLAGIMWLNTDWSWNGSLVRSPRASEQTVRLMVWNISSGKRGWDGIADEIQRWNPDVICLVESGSSRRREMWQGFFPEYDVSMLGGRIVCIVRGTSGECTPIELTPSSRLRILPVEVRGVSFLCAIADIESSIFNSRETPLMQLAEHLDRLTGPLVVAGDFNTPLDSVHLAPLEDQFESAFREIGSGYGATWPLPLPVLTLDQVWYNDDINPRGLQFGWSSASDHRPVIFEFTVVNDLFPN